MMRRMLLPLATAMLAFALAAGAFARPAATTLKGTVGPGFTINLTSGGKKVKTLKPGTYKFVIADKGSIHNFVLEQEKGGKFEKALTGVGFTGTKTATMKLTKGTWKYYCQVHESSMNGTFTVK
jgi:plastocyanin